MNGFHCARSAQHEAAVRDFLFDVAGSAACEQEQRLRDAARLLGLAGGLDAQPTFDAMLACGAYESATLLLIGGSEGFILSRGPNGTCMASSATGREDEDVTVQGATLSLALLSAYATVLLAGSEQPARSAWSATAAPAGTRLH